MPQPQATEIDRELVALAASALASVPPTNEDHTAAAAVRTRAGRTFVALNVYHFTGGPCAELAVLGAAAAGGVLADAIATVVTVARPRRPDDRRHFDAAVVILNPCGRCRQVLFDYNPDIDVIVCEDGGNEGGEAVRVVKVRDLLPFAYSYAARQ